jgi:hypothetical protein
MSDGCIRFIVTLALVASLLWGATVVCAEVRVLQSQVPNIVTGQVLRDDTVLHVPPNKTVRVLLTPSNSTKTIAGPFDGKAYDYGPSRMPNLGDKPTREFDAGTVATGATGTHFDIK